MLRRTVLALPLVTCLVGIALMSTNQAAPEKTPVLRHVVLFKFKQDATAQQVQQIVDAFRQLPQQITAIQGFEYGTDISPEGLSKGFTHCFLVTFKSEKDRDDYLPHPAHQAFVARLRPILDDVTVVDYWAKE